MTYHQYSRYVSWTESPLLPDQNAMDHPHAIFLDLVLSGARFDEGGVPVETLEEFRRYRALVVDVARTLFFEENPERKRVPRGFEDQFELTLTAVREGSAIGQLSRLTSEPELPGMTVDLFERAREQINACIEAVSKGEGIPADFPHEALRHFKSFGKTLRDGESMEFRRASEEEGPRLSKPVRQQIVRSLGDEYEEETVLSGRLVDVDTKNGTFRVEDSVYGGVTCRLPRDDEQRVLQVHKSYRAVGLRVSGAGLFSSDGTLKIIQEIDQIDDVDLGPDFQGRIDELRKLEDGWLDGNGFAPSAELFQRIDALLTEVIYEHNTYVPYLYPTPEGGIQAEWQFREGQVSVEIEFTPEETVEILAHRQDKDEWDEETWSIDDPGLAKRLADFVNGFEEVFEDPLPENPAHCVIDVSGRSSSQERKLARKLRDFAQARGPTYQP